MDGASRNMLLNTFLKLDKMADTNGTELGLDQTYLSTCDKLYILVFKL